MKERVPKPQSMNSSARSNPRAVEILQDLIRFPSVTPARGDIFDYLEAYLSPLGFQCHRFVSGSVENLYAIYGELSPNLCFAGHVDVVPAGDIEAWTQSPFEPLIQDHKIIGRGAVDMKGAIAAYLSALEDLITNHRLRGKVSLLITGDEEGDAVYGTAKALEYVNEKGLLPDYCLVGEPTSETTIADTIKIGRRGSLTGKVKIAGIQGHVAYPDKALNPIHELIQFLNLLQDKRWDEGNDQFQPTNLEIISLSPFNEVSNVIPGEAEATFNIRFNTNWTRESLIHEINDLLVHIAGSSEIIFNQGAQPFYSEDKPFIRCLTTAIQDITGQIPILSTSGGTSDARFIYQYCPVLELGLRNATAHQVDEYVDIDDLLTLQKVYTSFITRFFEL